MEWFVFVKNIIMFYSDNIYYLKLCRRYHYFTLANTCFKKMKNNTHTGVQCTSTYFYAKSINVLFGVHVHESLCVCSVNQYMFRQRTILRRHNRTRHFNDKKWLMRVVGKQADEYFEMALLLNNNYVNLPVETTMLYGWISPTLYKEKT